MLGLQERVYTPMDKRVQEIMESEVLGGADDREWCILEEQGEEAST